MTSSDPSAEAAHKRYDEFVIALKGGGTVYYLIKESRFGCCIYEGEKEPVVLFWADSALAEQCREERFEEYEMGECTADDFLTKILPYLDEREGWVGTNYDRAATGISVRPRALITEISGGR